jgi:hypothetical protein
LGLLLAGHGQAGIDGGFPTGGGFAMTNEINGTRSGHGRDSGE